MPPLGNKSKNKVKDNRQSRSRNTTPSSVLSAPISAVSADADSTSYLKLPLRSLAVPNSLLYEDIVDRNAAGGIPDPRHLESLANYLRNLSDLASGRENECDRAVRELKSRRQIIFEDEREREREQREKREAEEKANIRKTTEDDEEDESPKAGKLKRKRDLSRAKEERPLAVGAHAVARQDGIDSKLKLSPSPSKVKPSAGSGSSSSLSPPSQMQSPTLAVPNLATVKQASPAPSNSSTDSRQPPPAVSIPQYQVFGANPLTFQDPTIYHVREVQAEMTDDEKREIYSVADFPHDDLRHLIAGTIPDKDFSNAKPSNQVNANTFQTYTDTYTRPLTDEDLQWLRERGDRVTPFMMPRRNTKSYQQIWAEEDGIVTSDFRGKDKLPPNEPRGSIELIDDAVAESEEVSAGPMLSRLLSTMRFEHRPEEREKMNGLTNGETDFFDMDTTIDNNNNEERPSATYFPESSNPAWKAPHPPRQDFSQVDERLKQELRHIGFLGQEDEPEYDAHYDDEVAQRLRFLQAELREVMIANGAKKACLLQIAEDHMGYQEFATIRDDLDSQVTQAFSKRNRLTGKGKKNVKRPTPGAPTGAGAGVSRPGIGDAARTLMDRRRRWQSTIGPIFGEEVMHVRGPGDNIFDEETMAPLLAAERERLEEELQLANLA